MRAGVASSAPPLLIATSHGQIPARRNWIDASRSRLRAVTIEKGASSSPSPGGTQRRGRLFQDGSNGGEERRSSVPLGSSWPRHRPAGWPWLWSPVRSDEGMGQRGAATHHHHGCQIPRDRPPDRLAWACPRIRCGCRGSGSAMAAASLLDEGRRRRIEPSVGGRGRGGVGNLNRERKETFFILTLSSFLSQSIARRGSPTDRLLLIGPSRDHADPAPCPVDPSRPSS